MSSIVTKAFNALLPNGRACAMQGLAIRMLRDSALSLTENAIAFLRDIGSDQFSPTMREDAVIQWEKQFGLMPSQGASLLERQEAVERAWNVSGAQGPGYIQQQLNNAGFDVVVTENLPIQDLLVDTMLSMSEVGISMTDFEDGIGMGEGFDGYLFGNGVLLLDNGGYADPILKPTGAGPGVAETCTETDTSMSEVDPTMGDGINSWAYVFMLEGAGSTFAQVPAGRRAEFENLVLRLKPAHLGVLMKVQYN